MGDFSIDIDVEKKRAFLKFKGFFKEEEMKKAIDQSISDIRILGSGFDVISDISQFKASSQEAGNQITRAAKTLVEMGMNKIVRIVGNSAIAKMQFQRTTEPAGYEAKIVSSLEEAEAYLKEN